MPTVKRVGEELKTNTFQEPSYYEDLKIVQTWQFPQHSPHSIYFWKFMDLGVGWILVTLQNSNSLIKIERKNLL